MALFLGLTAEYDKVVSVRCVLKSLTVLVLFALMGTHVAYAEEEIEFNTDVLDVQDRSRIDLKEFSRAGYIMPGDYQMMVRLNKSELSEMPVTFMAPPDDLRESVACLSPDLVKQLGLKAEWESKITWWNNNQCLEIKTLPGMMARGDLGSDTLYLSVPQAYLEYSSSDWDPPSRWDEGILGMLFDYNVNAQVSKLAKGNKNQNVSANGTTGINLGAWRLRADWQAQYNHVTGRAGSTEKNWDWSRYYMYRAIPHLQAKLTLGEDYLNSGIFDSFRFTGVSLVTDDNMLPPNLRGYAPEVTGVAKTNAKVTIRQQGRVLYETQVAPGPFRIQDINNAVSGKLDVRVEEQDGGVQEFQIDTANIPYLTRPGRVQYKLAAGKPTNWKHHSEGQGFGVGEFSWGINNGWSLYGGILGAGDYNALSLGLGRDLMAFGALSFDVTQSRAHLPNEDQTLIGGSYRLSYSKRFEEYDSQVTFAGYRFSERDFMSMSQYLDRRYHDGDAESGKELYSIMLNKQFTALDISTYLNYSHQTYWNRPNNDRYNLSVSRYFAIGTFKNINLNLSAYRNKYEGKNDDGMYLTLSLPWGHSGTISYNAMVNRRGNSNTVGYYGRINENNNYRLAAGTSIDGKAVANGYVTHYGDHAQLTTSASYQDGHYTTAALSVQGGVTATTEGAALHRINMPGTTRLMVDTEGVGGVPVKGFGAIAHTNMFGKAVIPDVNNYYRNSASIDLNKLPDNVEAIRSVQQATLTEGAIGYRKFQVISGEKAMGLIRLSDGSTPPFGATVLNKDKREIGIVNDGGSTYLSGINPGEKLDVRWDGELQCVIELPPKLPAVEEMASLLLLCQLTSGNNDHSTNTVSSSPELMAATLN
ncbi:outer membrane usher protein [Photorhabdus heterorhabditis]|uniref:Outer membrane usher protein n=1 Tax=Photorhabdus heterorhabditis TaxID=880156 RepID=A0A5B0WYU3_9GAMM|nr:outer membrane usher protein [Photorhabdus heterorhabditis]KAA1192274.1 outer membrane usher protein [Photorhabdus heterorhabditis]